MRDWKNMPGKSMERRACISQKTSVETQTIKDLVTEECQGGQSGSTMEYKVLVFIVEVEFQIKDQVTRVLIVCSKGVDFIKGTINVHYKTCKEVIEFAYYNNDTGFRMEGRSEWEKLEQETLD